MVVGFRDYAVAKSQLGQWFGWLKGHQRIDFLLSLDSSRKQSKRERPTDNTLKAAGEKM